jgi:MFS family permease
MNPPAPAAPAPTLRQHPSFLRYWCSRLVGTMGSQMLLVAVGWQMYDLTRSAWDLGLVGLAQFLPSLLLTLPAGHAADHHDRRRIAAACLAAQCVVALLLVLGSAEGWIGRSWILALSVVLGAARAFQMTSQQALAPQLVPPALLPRALAFSASAMQFAVISGPAVGGFVYVAGATAVYALCAALFGAATALMLSVRYRHQAPPREPVTWQTVLAGVHFIRSRPVVLGAISLDLFAVLLGGAGALLPIYARDILHTGPWGLGLLRAAPAVGALALSLALTRWPLQRRVGRVLFASVAGYGLATLVFAVSTAFWLSLLALLVCGACDMVSVVIRSSMVQLDTPDAMRGRVSAVNSIFIGASNELGEFESGATAALLGPVGSVLLGGFGTLLVVVVWMRLFPPLARRDRLVQAEPA